MKMKNDTPKIKICGLRRMEEIEYANRLLPDFIGFIFVSDRRRYIEPDTAAKLYTALDRRIQAVGVFIDEPLICLERLLSLSCMDVIQLHGTEDDTYIAAVRAMTDKPIIKAFSVRSAEDIKRAQDSAADWILLDSKSAGSGTTFDWSLLSSLNRPFFLAGGLHPGNVREAIALTHPYALDVSSGVETDNRKDFVKMQELIRAVRSDLPLSAM